MAHISQLSLISNKMRKGIKERKVGVVGLHKLVSHTRTWYAADPSVNPLASAQLSQI